jgi:hypothetical protein
MDYKSKYLKYKNKYLKLKQSGGSFESFEQFEEFIISNIGDDNDFSLNIYFRDDCSDNYTETLLKIVDFEEKQIGYKIYYQTDFLNSYNYYNVYKTDENPPIFTDGDTKITQSDISDYITAFAEKLCSTNKYYMKIYGYLLKNRDKIEIENISYYLNEAKKNSGITKNDYNVKNINYNEYKNNILNLIYNLLKSKLKSPLKPMQLVNVDLENV